MIRAILVAVLAAAPAFASSEHHDHTAPPKDFERLAKLLGHWEAALDGGKTAHVWIKLIAGGTTLLETEKIGDEPEMITVFHPDGKDVVLTHYCSANNQPHMKLVKADDKELHFDFVSATNLSSPDASHMSNVTFSFIDEDHYNENWTWTEKGKKESALFKFERKKPEAAKP